MLHCDLPRRDATRRDGTMGRLADIKEVKLYYINFKIEID